MRLPGRVQIGESVAILGAGGIGFDVALYLLERASRSTLDPHAFSRHWGISADAAGSRRTRRERTPAGATCASHHHAEALAHAVRPHARAVDRMGASRGTRAQRRENAQGSRLQAHRRAGLHITLEGAEVVVPADTIVICAGQEPQRALAVALEARGRTAHLIGGAREAGELDAKRAMLEGAELAARL
jgi:2,4-dienoyl-CoA reductase (NADPH2)